MGQPHENPEGYKLSSVLTHCESMKGRLLIIHGKMDENVHFQHSERFAASLRDAGKQPGVDYSLMQFPEERHYPRSTANRLFMEHSIFNFFQEVLAPSSSSSSSAAAAFTSSPTSE